MEEIKLERELASKIFILEKYNSKENMEEDIKEYMKRLREDYPSSVVTREFYKGSNVLVRATQIIPNVKVIKNDIEKQEELEKEEVRIKERGINGLGENVNRTIKNGKSREKEMGYSARSERERGTR